jgi:hypothetical protein
MADFDFGLLESSRQLMPLVPLSFPKIQSAQFVGLVDSGAGATRIHADLAKPLGVVLDELPIEKFVVANKEYVCRMADVQMRVGTMKERTITVGFTYGWVAPHFLLGIRGFFETYTVTINAGKSRTSVKPS